MAQGKNTENIFGYEEFFFIGGVPVPGVQSVQFSYNLPTSPLIQLGGRGSLIVPKGDKIGQVSVSAGLISDDPFYRMTGSVGVNGFLFEDMNQKYTNNFGFISGYLTSYSQQYSLGNLPQVQANFSVFSNIGKFNENHPSEITSEINSLLFQSTGLFQEIHQGCAVVSFSQAADNPLISYEININCPRIPIYSLNKDTPRHVLLGKPMEITLNMQFEDAVFQNFNLKGYPNQTNTESITISLKNKNGDTVNSYPLGTLQLSSVSKQTAVNSPDLRTLTYKRYLG